MICRQCGLELPDRARFCARCGAALTPPGGPQLAADPGGWGTAAPARPAAGRRPPLWLLLVFWIGSVLPLLVAIIYAVIAVDPTADGGASGLSSADVQRSAVFLAVSATVLLVLQLAAAAALTAGQPWGRLVATVVCALWMLSCVGIPVAVLALSVLWRKTAEPPRPPV
ncbi:MAG TPA: zinc-ribbon domain-containing protein [Candidatus Binatia bacterium]|nr:zinc-ribbon domain-containing protein [Candidatus Binatia bacterium]